MHLLTIESLDYEGRGIAHVEGKTIFVDNALPGELVECEVYKKKTSYEQANATRILRASSERITPHCAHFGLCGGCSQQHMGTATQVATKQRVLEDALWHIAGLKPDEISPPIIGESFGYRLRARLSARYVQKKGGALVGFREKHSSYVAVMDSCAVLPPQVSSLIPALKTLFALLSAPERLPQIEVAVGENKTALVLRHLAPLTLDDEDQLRRFADTHHISWYLQSGGPDTTIPLNPTESASLLYTLPDFGITLSFSPTEFTQVNLGINRMLVRRAMTLLNPQPDDRIGDLFCGLGNFSLPIARLGANVLGIEGSQSMVQRAQENAQRNALASRCEFRMDNLFKATPESFAALGHFDKLLIDPPRDGAMEIVKSLLTESAPQRIVYVSCNPATLARDAEVLVNTKGYTLRSAGIACMFPHTSHVESIALFEHAT
ncbi:MAG: 23S rRNA (uracil(1939)-C(5))-methyltransferase RlmD [Rhodocyclaceae bacterium]|nr:23S rRNA (uracil(1939)-C(5))-methyltransferase RlmD [Rhodocyclaceae bacterium]